MRLRNRMQKAGQDRRGSLPPLCPVPFSLLAYFFKYCPDASPLKLYSSSSTFIRGISSYAFPIDGSVSDRTAASQAKAEIGLPGSPYLSGYSHLKAHGHKRDGIGFTRGLQNNKKNSFSLPIRVFWLYNKFIARNHFLLLMFYANSFCYGKYLVRYSLYTAKKL